MNQVPPKWITNFLNWFCPDHLLEEIEGDLIQKFEKDVDQLGATKAKRKFIWNTIRYLRPGIVMRNRFSFLFGGGHMLTSHYKSAYRQLIRNKIFTLINVVGLSIGISVFILITQYVSFETGYDQFHKNGDEIYRVAYKRYENGALKGTSAKNFIGIRNLLVENFPEVKNSTGFWVVPANTGFAFGYSDKVYLESGKFLMVDSNFFKVFPSLLKKGGSNGVLSDPHKLIINEKLAEKIFGDKEPIGQHIIDLADNNNDGSDFFVSGIMADVPENSHFHADFISMMGNDWDTLTYYWDVPSFYTYISIPVNTDVNQFEIRLNNLLGELGTTQSQMEGSKAFLQPLASIHLESQLQDELETNGSKSLVFILSLIGLIILITAWINYINLETAQFSAKAREIGVRRIIGSTKLDIALQFLAKYCCVGILAIVLSGVIIILFQSHFTLLAGISMTKINLMNPSIWWVSFAVFISGSLLIGIYPAFLINSQHPASFIKGNSNIPGSGRHFRRSLVVIQFTSSLALIAFLIVVSQQLDFMRLANKNIDIDQVVALENALAYDNSLFEVKRKEFENLQNKLLESPLIKQVCSSSAIPGTEIGFNLVNEIKRNETDPYNPTRFKLLFIDHNFIPLYNLKLKAGRNYLAGNSSDESNDRVILNEAAIHELGFNSSEEALGQMIHFPLWPWMNPKSEIIGIVEDFNHEAVKMPVMPTIFFLNTRGFQQVYFSIKLAEGNNTREALTYIEKSWKEIFPTRPFKYLFLDDFYDKQFKAELQFERIFGLFSVIAILLAGLGIFGMTLFEASARLKEISIRKVLGASVASLVALLSGDHIRIVIYSSLLASPIIYISTSRWLSNYPMRIELSPWFFILPIAVTLIAVFLTSSFQTLEAANSNPVDHLKNE
ncbi:MAG: permease prefix domain 2-containing transporter [Cyclobacteriaceae bacterium]